MEGHNHSRLLRVSSKDRSVSSASQYDIVYRTNDSDLHQVKRIELKSALIPNTYYNINANNNLFFFPNSDSGLSSYTVPIGQYTIATLITELNTLVAVLTVTESTLTGRLTFTISAGTMDIISDSAVNPMAPILGMLVTVLATAGPVTVSGVPNLNGLKSVYISSQSLSSHSSMIASEKLKRNIFCSIPVDVPYGVYMTWDENDNTLDYTLFASHKNISSIDIKLLDDNNDVVDLNGLDWELIFRIYH